MEIENSINQETPVWSVPDDWGPLVITETLINSSA